MNWLIFLFLIQLTLLAALTVVVTTSVSLGAACLVVALVGLAISCGINFSTFIAG